MNWYDLPLPQVVTIVPSSSAHLRHAIDLHRTRVVLIKERKGVPYISFEHPTNQASMVYQFNLPTHLQTTAIHMNQKNIAISWEGLLPLERTRKLISLSTYEEMEETI